VAAFGALRRPSLWPVALAGFLARGGIVLFVAPIVVPPSLVGLATFIGPASITPTGPTSGLIIRIAAGAGLLAAAVLLGTIVGSIAELALIDEARAASGRLVPGLLRRVVLIRLIGLLPVAIILGLEIERLGQIVYEELTLPSDLVSPMAVRVAVRAPEVVAAIVIAWLAGETWAGLATRLAVLRDAGVRRALTGALALSIRRAATILPLAVLSVGLAAGVLALAVGLVAWSWDFVRNALLGGSGIADLVAVAGATVLFAACWLIGLSAAGALAAGRAVAWTLVVGEDHRGSGGIGPERATL
jgi:hypothetical protein